MDMVVFRCLCGEYLVTKREIDNPLSEGVAHTSTLTTSEGVRC